MICLNRFDAEFSARTSKEDWRRIVHLRDHSRYLDGVAFYDEHVPALFANNFVLNKAVTDYARFQTIVFTLHLYDTYDANKPSSTGLTLSRLQKLCVAYNISSPGGVVAFVGLMLFAGYLKRQQCNEDKRVVHLEPTASFVNIVESWTRRVLQSIDTIVPGAALTNCHEDHPRFGWDMREHSTQNVLNGWKPLDPFPEALHFVGSHGGWMLLCRCVSDMLRKSRTEISPISVDLVAFGKRFGVSRTHLRRMLESAFDKGLLDAPPRNGSNIVMSEKLFASCMAAQASELSNYRLCALAAKSGLGLTPDRQLVDMPSR